MSLQQTLLFFLFCFTLLTFLRARTPFLFSVLQPPSFLLQLPLYFLFLLYPLSFPLSYNHLPFLSLLQSLTFPLCVFERFPGFSVSHIPSLSQYTGQMSGRDKTATLLWFRVFDIGLWDYTQILIEKNLYLLRYTRNIETILINIGKTNFQLVISWVKKPSSCQLHAKTMSITTWL